MRVVKMATNTKKGPLYDPGKCRCCGGMKKCRVLTEEYDHLGHKEVYSDMIMDCFGLLLTNMDGDAPDRLVCATCVVRLREAVTFKSQVLKCEEELLKFIHKDPDCKIEVEIKVEDGLQDSAPGSPRNYDEDHLTHCSDQNRDDDEDDKMLSELRIKSAEKPARDEQSEVSRSKRKDGRSEHLRLKGELMMRMQKMKRMISQRGKKQEPVEKPVKVRPVQKQPKAPFKARTLSPDRMTHHNRVVIVENSYVCPFKNRISNYYCFYCREIFTDCTELRNHSSSHDPRLFENFIESKRIPKIDITRIDCRLCPEKIDDIKTFKDHIVTAHKKIIYPNVANEFFQFKLSVENLRCLECDGHFVFIDKLIDHLTDHFGTFVCDVCGSCFIEEGTLLCHIRGHKKVDTDFPCDICGKTLKSNYSRQLHIATVHEKRPVVFCFKCDASFLSYAQRNRHLINVHGDKRKFPCKSCDKVFDVRKTLMEHNRKYHLQGCRHQCDVCDQRFFAPSQLKEHKSSHTGERSFICQFCQKSYPRRQSLLDHIRSHTNEKKYKCDICNSTFTQSGNLKNHMRTHHQHFEDIDVAVPGLM